MDTLRQIAIASPSLGEEESEAVRRVIESGWLTQGPAVADFEREFAKRHHTSRAAATTSCTTALHLALIAAGVRPGDEVIVPSFTWIATANAVEYCGARPVLVDIHRDSFNIDPAAVEAAVTDRTTAVIPVHLFGLCAEVDDVRSAVPEHVKIIEDAACAAGAEAGGRRAGSLGDVGCFSFHPRKSITTGEGGMITSNDEHLVDHVVRLRNHGAGTSEERRHVSDRPHQLPDFEELGFNYRMTDIQAAIGMVQLARLEEFIAERAHWAAWYKDQLAGLEWLRTPSEPSGGRHAWQAFVCAVTEDAPIARDDLMDALYARGVSTRPGTHAVHMQGYYQDKYMLHPHDLPNSSWAADNSIALPLHNRMAEADFEHVVDCLRKAR